jgi:hypothetical protein
MKPVATVLSIKTKDPWFVHASFNTSILAEKGANTAGCYDLNFNRKTVLYIYSYLTLRHNDIYKTALNPLKPNGNYTGCYDS